MARFSDKIAIVTGGGSGIGAATARLLASEAAVVTVADIDEAAAGALVDAIRSAGGTARAQRADVADPAAAEGMVAVNLTGPMLGCRFAIPAMLERGGGSIDNTASAAAFSGSDSLARLRRLQGGDRVPDAFRRHRVRGAGHPVQCRRSRRRRRP